MCSPEPISDFVPKNYKSLEESFPMFESGEPIVIVGLKSISDDMGYFTYKIKQVLESSRAYKYFVIKYIEGEFFAEDPYNSFLQLHINLLEINKEYFVCCKKRCDFFLSIKESVCTYNYHTKEDILKRKKLDLQNHYKILETHISIIYRCVSFSLDYITNGRLSIDIFKYLQTLDQSNYHVINDYIDIDDEFNLNNETKIKLILDLYNIIEFCQNNLLKNKFEYIKFYFLKKKLIELHSLCIEYFTKFNFIFNSPSEPSSPRFESMSLLSRPPSPFMQPPIRYVSPSIRLTGPPSPPLPPPSPPLPLMSPPLPPSPPIEITHETFNPYFIINKSFDFIYSII